MNEAADQITEEIEACLIWPLEMLLGPSEVFAMLRQRAATTARTMAAQLASGDDRLAAQTAIDLAGAILPEAIPDGFWATPLGRLMAQSVGHPSAEAVSFSVAAAMLRVSKGRVQQLVEAGQMDRHPDGGITTASVRARAQGMASSKATTSLSHQATTSRSAPAGTDPRIVEGGRERST